jgi:hypothetical protein
MVNCRAMMAPCPVIGKRRIGSLARIPEPRRLPNARVGVPDACVTGEDAEWKFHRLCSSGGASGWNSLSAALAGALESVRPLQLHEREGVTSFVNTGRNSRNPSDWPERLVNGLS